jgi:RNA polymerase sigma-70 factor (ECF subfamily)
MELASQRSHVGFEILPLRPRLKLRILREIRMPSDAKSAEDDLSSLIEALAVNRDRAAFAVLFDHFAPRIKGFLMRSNLSAGAAEDLAQETLLSVWRKAHQFDSSRASASAWVFAIARNLRIDGARRESRAMLLDFESSEEPASPTLPDNDILVGQRDQQVRAALAQLSGEQTRVVQLSFFEGKPHADIADELKIPLGTVKSRLRLAMKRLRELLVDL